MTRARLVVALPLALLGGACIHADVELVEPDGQSGAPGVTTSPRSVQTEIGESVTTSEGNTVTVHRVDDQGSPPDSDLEVLGADVEICADANGDGAPVAPDFFRAALDGGANRRPAVPAAREPQLDRVRIEADECARGWLSFPLRPDEQVIAIVLLASTTVEWSLP